MNYSWSDLPRLLPPVRRRADHGQHYSMHNIMHDYVVLRTYYLLRLLFKPLLAETA